MRTLESVISQMISTFTRFGFATVALALLLSGCNKDLEQRIDRLEAELREVRSDTRDDVTELKGRVISAETTVGVSNDGISFDDRIALIEKSMSEALSSKSKDTDMVYLRPLVQGHAPLNTDHGTFLVRIEGMDLNLNSNGFTVHLNIGNPHAIAIQQFTLKGDHGGGTPQLLEDSHYSPDNDAIKAWQKTLKPFEYRVAKTLEPFSWTPFDIELEADSREELELIRFAMIIENAQLNRPSGMGGNGSNQFSHLSIDSKGASVLKTEYGAFLMVIKNAVEDENGTKLDVEIGNPYGFTINQCRLLGDFGIALPRREDSASNEEYAEKMQQWSASLKPFESMISEKVSNFRWNKATIRVPAPADQVKFLRCQLRIEDVTLPAATDK